MRNLCLLALLLLPVGCNQSVQMTEEAAIATLHAFFELLDIEQYDKNALSEIVTDDFHIFEMGQDFTLDSFDAFIQEAQKTTVSTSWTLSDFVVSIEKQSAHVAYLNKGLFETFRFLFQCRNWRTCAMCPWHKSCRSIHLRKLNHQIVHNDKRCWYVLNSDES